MNYLFIHIEVRNDYHCPICRRYYISIHESIDDTLKLCTQADNDDNISIDDINLKLLKEGNAIWIDEWIRRGNGDKYQIIKIGKQEYNLGDSLINHDNKEISFNAKYMMLHIQVDKSAWCPENIIFIISFYESFDKACDKLLEDYYNKNCTDIYHDNDRCVYENKLKNNESIYVDNKNGGDFYQLIELEKDKQLYLNEYCQYIHLDNWFSSK